MDSARPASRPPTPNPALRIAWTKPNHCSRSPGWVIWVISGPLEPQNIVRPTVETPIARPTVSIESTKGYAANDAALDHVAALHHTLGADPVDQPADVRHSGVTARLATVITRPSSTRRQVGLAQEVEHRQRHPDPAAQSVDPERGDEPPVTTDVREPETLQHPHILQLQVHSRASGYRTARDGLALASPRMTFSIVARSDDGESWGVAVASKFLAVGAVVPAAVAQVGAIATQANANVAYKGLALAHLDDGATAPVALQRLLEEDEGRDHRQVGIVDLDGGAASHTGQACIDWAGGLTGDGYAIQGNSLAGSEVVEAMEAIWLAGEDVPFARRLLDALAAGDEAGGDKRGPAVGRAARRTRGGGVRRRRRHRRRPAGRRPRRPRSPSWAGCSTSTTST